MIREGSVVPKAIVAAAAVTAIGAHATEAVAPSPTPHVKRERKKRRRVPPLRAARHPWHRHHRRRRTVDGPTLTVDSTAYCQSGLTASGGETYVGEVAMNELPLGTRIRASRSVFGRRRFRVEDRIGSGSELDFYTPDCAQADEYGRETITVTVER